MTIRATSACRAPSAKNTLGVDSDTTSTSIPTRSMSARRSAGSVIGAVTPKNRAPLWRMIVRPVGSVPNEKSPGVFRISSKYDAG